MLVCFLFKATNPILAAQQSLSFSIQRKPTKIVSTDHFSGSDTLEREGWHLRQFPRFIINNEEFVSFDIHQELKRDIYALKDHFIYGGEDEIKHRNIAMVKIEIVLQEIEPIHTNPTYKQINGWVKDDYDNPIIFQSGFATANLVQNYPVISGHQESNMGLIKVVDGLDNLFTHQSPSITDLTLVELKEEINQAKEITAIAGMMGSQRNQHLAQLFEGEQSFAGLYGHSEQFFINTLMSDTYLKYQIKKIVTKELSVMQRKRYKIIAIVLHLHSFRDLCKRCSVSLSKFAEILSSVMNTKTIIHNILRSDEELNVADNVGFLLVASSQFERTGRRQVMGSYRDHLYNEPFNMNQTGVIPFIQIDPQ